MQNYIKSLTVASTAPTSVLIEEQKTTCNEEWKGVVAYSCAPPVNCAGSATPNFCHASNTSLAPACYFNDGPNLLLDKQSMHEIYDVAHLFDRLGCGSMASSSEGNKDFEMAMEWGATMPPLMMPTSSENVKREMDLMEMISQNNILHGPF